MTLTVLFCVLQPTQLDDSSVAYKKNLLVSSPIKSRPRLVAIVAGVTVGKAPRRSNLHAFLRHVSSDSEAITVLGKFTVRGHSKFVVLFVGRAVLDSETQVQSINGTETRKKAFKAPKTVLNLRP